MELTGSVLKCPRCDGRGVLPYDGRDGSDCDENGEFWRDCECYSHSSYCDTTPAGFVALPMTSDLAEHEWFADLSGV